MLDVVECAMDVPHAAGGFWSNLFSDDFVARGRCIGDRPEIAALHIAADAATALAYFSIPVALVVFLRRRKDLAFPAIFWLFAAFILLCGTTHIFDILAFFRPMYRLDGVVKALTGGVSLVTAGVLWPLIPRALSLPSRSELESRVARRTSELAAVSRDAEEARGRAERKLAEIEAIYAGAPAGLAFVDAAGRFVRVNPAFAGVFGVPLESVVDRSLAEAGEMLGQELHDAVRRALADGASTPALGLRLAGPEPRHAVASVRPAVSPAGARLGVSLVIQDSTERDLLQEQVRQSQKSEAIGQLAAGIAHEINNALTAIYGYLSLGRACFNDNQAGAAYLDQILIAAQQASSVTKSLLTFASRERTKRESVDLKEAVDRAASLLHGLLPANIRLRVDTGAVAGLSVLGDSNQLQQVVLNLAINARDAMPAGGLLEIRAAPALTGRGDAGVRISVRDEGVGMSIEVQQRAFEPFFTTKPRGRGTGLGLSVVHGIVSSHEGEIRIRSAPGEGTTVEIELPLAKTAAAAPAATPEQHPVPVSGTVLLAEDNRTIRQMFAAVLRQKGFSVIEAADGVELMSHAAALAAVGAPLLVAILDIDMPGRSGVECLRLMRERGDDTPVVLISGGPMEALDLPNVSILPKPFSTQDLLAAVAGVVRRAPQPGAAPSPPEP